MRPLSKLCDAADWFDPEFAGIIRHELDEEPRFHRKQWEFAQIFRTLQTLGFLNGKSRGLSMGGGEERLLYAVARRAGHLTVTDLYSANSAWDGARTDDPDRLLKGQAPFAVDPSRLTARRMDMRTLEFEDGAFDFCYSSCAIEHIGGYDDFLRHLQEVRRVLKDDGVYVLTTEFHYGDAVIPSPHNYYFSSGFLDDLMKAASLVASGGVDSTVSPHVFNRPVPEKLGDLCADPADPVTHRLLDSAAHVQLLTGSLPFTSMCLMLTKTVPGASGGVLPMVGLEGSRQYIGEGVACWRAFIERAALNLDPFGLLSDRRPTRGIPSLAATGRDNTLFHTGYVWLGGAARTVTMELEAWPAGNEEASIELRLHRHGALRPDTVVCCASVIVAIGSRRRVRVSLPIAADEGSSYAVLGQLTTGACWYAEAAVLVSAGNAGTAP